MVLSFGNTQCLAWISMFLFSFFFLHLLSNVSFAVSCFILKVFFLFLSLFTLPPGVFFSPLVIVVPCPDLFHLSLVILCLTVYTSPCAALRVCQIFVFDCVSLFKRFPMFSSVLNMVLPLFSSWPLPIFAFFAYSSYSPGILTCFGYHVGV